MPLFLPRHVNTVDYELEPYEKALYEAVTDYVANGLEQAESTRNRNVGLALTVLQRRLASSLYAITRSLERRRDRLSAELDQSRASGRIGDRPRTFEFDIDSDEDLEELTDEEEEALSAASNARTPDELKAEIDLLNHLVEQARDAREHGPEKKLREFLGVVENETVSRQHEKILVFTEHRDTLTYITEQLRARGCSVTNIHGGMKLQDRIAAEKDFRGPVQFLVATDAAGEGINLQFCRVMINWDLPWNPNRLEQRMGRIHRYGQEFEVQIVNLVAGNTREGAVLVRLMNKLEAMKAAMGHDQVYDVISGVLDGAQVRLDALMRAAILNRKSRDDILRGTGRRRWRRRSCRRSGCARRIPRDALHRHGLHQWGTTRFQRAPPDPGVRRAVLPRRAPTPGRSSGARVTIETGGWNIFRLKFAGRRVPPIPESSAPKTGSSPSIRIVCGKIRRPNSSLRIILCSTSCWSEC